MDNQPEKVNQRTPIKELEAIAFEYDIKNVIYQKHWDQWWPVVEDFVKEHRALLQEVAKLNVEIERLNRKVDWMAEARDEWELYAMDNIAHWQEKYEKLKAETGYEDE